MAMLYVANCNSHYITMERSTMLNSWVTITNYQRLPSGKHTKSYWSHGPSKSLIYPLIAWWFSIAMLVITRGYPLMHRISPLKSPNQFPSSCCATQCSDPNLLVEGTAPWDWCWNKRMLKKDTSKNGTWMGFFLINGHFSILWMPIWLITIDDFFWVSSIIW